MTKKVMFGIAAALFLAFCFDLGVFLSPLYSGKCQYANYEQYKNCSGYVSVTIFVAHFIDKHHWVVEATAAIAIAVFTATLWRSTDKLWEAGERQIGIATSAANAAKASADTARLELRAYVGHEPGGAHFADVAYIVANQTIHAPQEGPVKYFEKNFGKSPASAIEMFVGIVEGATAPDVIDTSVLVRQDVIGYAPPGQNIGRIVQTPDNKKWRRDDKFFLFGYVDYSDIFNQRWRRSFGFTHDLDRAKDNGEEWVAEGKHHHEQRLRQQPDGSWKPA